MKKNYIVKLLAVMMLIFAGVACKNKADKDDHAMHQHTEGQQYNCPMHPQIVQDKPGTCPICGMELVARKSGPNEMEIDSNLARLLKPVNEQIISSVPTITPDDGMKIISAEVQGLVMYDTRNKTSIASRVSGRIERLLIKYNYQPVKKGQLIMEIYSPDLAAAQRELLFIYRTDKNDEMLQRARQRLLLLGMQPAQIDQLIRTGKPSYSVPVYSKASGYILENAIAVSPTSQISATPSGSSSGDDMNAMGATPSSNNNLASSAPAATPVLIREGQYVNAGQSLFTIYQANSLVAEFSFDPELAAQIKKGQKLVFHSTADPEKIYTGTIGLIEPVFQNGQNFSKARVYIRDTDLQAGQLITANIPIVKKKGWWVPKEAVWQLGNKAIVFKKEDQVFKPKEVSLGITTTYMIQVMDDISDWQIAGKAHYLVDSESFIRIKDKNSDHR